MNESIVDYIEKTYTVEMQEVLMKALKLFDRLNLETYEAFILNTLNNIENEDPEFISSTIATYVEGLLVSLEKVFGFRLHEQGAITLEQRVDFVAGYVALEDYIDHQTIIRICETDMLDAERLAEAVSLTTEYGVETLMSFIDYVDEAAIMTLSRLHLSETPAEEKADEQEAPEVSPEQITQIKAYELFMQQNNLTVDCYTLVRAGFPIGAPFKVYWEQYKHIFEDADRATLVKEALGLYLLSKEHWGNPVLAFNNLVEELFDSVQVITECNVEMRNLMNGFVKFKGENKIK